jgi:hypothetical protein
MATPHRPDHLPGFGIDEEQTPILAQADRYVPSQLYALTTSSNAEGREE